MAFTAVAHDFEPSIVIVGIGNWQVESDSLGPSVLAMLEGRYGETVFLKNIGTTPLGLLECLDSQDLMLIVDACVIDGIPGRIHVQRPDLDAEPQNLPTLHHIGPLETLMVARHLYPRQLPKNILLVLVETEGLERSMMNAARREVISIIDKEISNILITSGA